MLWMKENAVMKAEVLFSCVLMKCNCYSQCQLANHQSFSKKMKYAWIDFQCEIHEINEAAPLKARVDERVGTAGEIPRQREGGYHKGCWNIR